MPALTNILDRIESDPAWRSAFTNNRSLARTISKGLPLVHVIDGTTNVARLIIDDMNRLRVSTKGTSSSNTIDTEEAYSLGQCLYLYAGRAYPRVGGVAFVFASPIEDSNRGHATPFDTGGMFKGYIASNLANGATRDFVAQSLIEPLAIWRERFEVFLAAYFDPLTAYWDDRPCKEDPEGIFRASSNTWQAWCFEVRLHEEQDFLDASFWCGSEVDMQMYRRQMQNAPHKVDTMAKFLAKSLAAAGTLDYVGAIERKLREDIGMP